MRSLLCTLLFAATLGAGPAPSPPPRPGFVWHPEFTDLDERADFSAAKVLERVPLYRSLDQLLEDPLFVRYRSVDHPGQAVDDGRPHAASVYMAKSEGNHGEAASKAYPRVLTVAGSTAFAVYTDPSFKEAYQTLEMIDVDPAAPVLHFYSVSYASGAPVVRKDPPLCLGCHTDRHIWRIYRFWPGLRADGEAGAFGRKMAPQDDIGFTMNLYEQNVARIARLVLADPAYAAVERPVIAALLDCPVAGFRFATSPEFQARLAATHTRYYGDLKELLDEVNLINDEKAPYTVDPDGTVETEVEVNEKDPVRFALLGELLSKTKLDPSAWAISREPGGHSLLFQASGAFGLSRLAYYLIENSPRRAALAALVPGAADLTDDAFPQTPSAVCTRLLAP